MPDEEPRVLSLLSHELRGPLGVIRGYLRMLSQSGPELSDRSRETVAAALRAADRLAEILDEASLLAHFQVGKVSLEPRKTSVASVVQAALQAATLPAGVTAEVEPVPELDLDADERHLSGALATLIMLVPIAVTIVEGHGGTVRELRHGERSAGVVVTLPIA
jgi:signal transduction histidine kinase